MKKEDVSLLLMWFYAYKRNLPWRKTNSDYAIHISEIMLQQTRVDTVIPYYHRFLNLFPNYHALATADEEVLLKAWQGLGYYSRAKNLKYAAEIIDHNYQGHFPNNYQEGIKIKGVGEYTCAAILSRAYELKYAAIDGNVLRVYSRLFALKKEIQSMEAKKEIQTTLNRWIQSYPPGHFNEAFMELGATICLPNGVPLCDQCPLNTKCKAHLLHQETNYPIKKKKKEKQIIENTCVFFIDQNQSLLFFKKQNGVLKDLPSPYLIDKQFDGRGLEDYLSSEFSISHVNRLPNKKHVFTHQIWYMEAYVVELKQLPQCKIDYLVSIKQLEESLALPTCFQKFIPDLLIYIKEHDN